MAQDETTIYVQQKKYEVYLKRSVHRAWTINEGRISRPSDGGYS